MENHKEHKMSTTRREFFAASGLAAAAIGLTAGAAGAAEHGSSGELTEHTLPDLPYAYDALEPYIDAETMELHHTRHHQAYVTGLNAAEKALAEARASGDFDLVQHWSRRAAFNGGGHALHVLFWATMRPADNGGGGAPEGDLAALVDKSFGSFDKLKAHLGAAAKGVEGSGWGLLHYRKSDDQLIVLQAENQQKYSTWDSVPILGVDVWEHAYYVKYRNNRGAYVDNWWNVVAWGEVAKLLEAARA